MWTLLTAGGIRSCGRTMGCAGAEDDLAAHELENLRRSIAMLDRAIRPRSTENGRSGSSWSCSGSSAATDGTTLVNELRALLVRL